VSTSPSTGSRKFPSQSRPAGSRASAQSTATNSPSCSGRSWRALYQRKQGRDLFDLATALQRTDVAPERIVAAFLEYMKHGGHKVTRAQFEKNIAAKLLDPAFTADIGPLLAGGFA